MHCMALIVHDVASTLIRWLFVPRESYASWYGILSSLKRDGLVPTYIVCDGQRGMLKAINELFPEVLIQRCIAHVVC